MALARLVNKVLFDLRLIERALHGPSTWTAKWAGIIVPLASTVSEEGIAFTAEFSEFCLISEPHPVVEIQVDGETIAWREIEHPGDGGFTFKWSFTIDADLVAA